MEIDKPGLLIRSLGTVGIVGVANRPHLVCDERRDAVNLFFQLDRVVSLAVALHTRFVQNVAHESLQFGEWLDGMIGVLSHDFEHGDLIPVAELAPSLAVADPFPGIFDDGLIAGLQTDQEVIPKGTPLRLHLGLNIFVPDFLFINCAKKPAQ